MALIFYILIILILMLLFKLLKDKNVIITIFCSILIIYIIIAPKFCIEATLSGAKLFFYKVFPSLFPFLILINIIISYKGVHIYSKIFGKILCTPLRLKKECSFPLIISALCGYPLGAKYSCDVYNNGHIDFSTCQRLISIASNASPLFIIGSIGTSMLENPYAGYVLLLSNYISCIIIGLLLPIKNPGGFRLNKNAPVIIENNIGQSLKISIENALKTCINIGGFIVLFSLLLSIIKNNIFSQYLLSKICFLFNIDKNLIEGFLLGLVEMTNGCYLISLSSTNMCEKLVLISFLLAFSGLSIICQVYSFTYKHHIDMKKYIRIKFVQGFIASIVSLILYKIPLFNITLDTFVYKKNSFILNKNLLFVSIWILIIIPLLIYYLKHLNKA